MVVAQGNVCKACGRSHTLESRETVVSTAYRRKRGRSGDIDVDGDVPADVEKEANRTTGARAAPAKHADTHGVRTQSSSDDLVCYLSADPHWRAIANSRQPGHRRQRRRQLAKRWTHTGEWAGSTGVPLASPLTPSGSTVSSGTMMMICRVRYVVAFGSNQRSLVLMYKRCSPDRLTIWRTRRHVIACNECRTPTAKPAGAGCANPKLLSKKVPLPKGPETNSKTVSNVKLPEPSQRCRRLSEPRTLQR